MTNAQAIAQAHAALEAKSADVAKCPWRPAYHFAAPAGWINDPNGLVHFRGEYHLFYQHHPYSAKWGPMHWGHAVSADLLRWRHLPIALAPTEPYEFSGDACGCFSGSAVEHEGKLVLMYTGDSPAHTPRETQCIATSDDGVVFSKHSGNPVIANFPAEGSHDFRDPRIWRHGDEFYALVGTGRDGIGKVVLYRSLDLANWEYLGVAAQSDGSQGHMWECPDLGETHGQHVLTFSPMGLGRPLSMYMAGRFDYGRDR
jgi:beta-fructofuranosidase